MEKISFYKVFNVEIESNIIEVAPNVYLESNPNFIDFTSYSELHRFGNVNFDDMRFIESLLKSSVALYTIATEKELDEDPFAVPECADIATALSIFSNYYLICGLGYRWCDIKEINDNYIFTETNLFYGEKGNKNMITNNSIPNLQKIYSFVRTFAHSLDSSEGKLILLYLRAILSNHYLQPRINLLGSGYPDFINEKSRIIVNSVLFFECVFPSVSDRKKKETSINKWNEVFVEFSIQYADFYILNKYRHTIFHDNATDAKKEIEKWINKEGYFKDEAFDKAIELSITNVKKVMYAIALNHDLFSKYWNMV